MMDTPDRKHAQHPPTTQACHGSEGSDHTELKQWDGREDKHKREWDGSKSPHKHMGSPASGHPSMQNEKEPHLEKPIQPFNALSLSHHFSKTDDPLSVSGPMDASNPHRVMQIHLCAASSDGRQSSTPNESKPGSNFAFPISSGFWSASHNLAPSFSGSHHMPPPVSLLYVPGLDLVTLDQAGELCQLAAECQVLGSEFAKKFCNLSSLKATTQSSVHEVLFSGHKAHDTTYNLALSMPVGSEREYTLHRLHKVAHKVQKETDDIVLTHLLWYDAELTAFIPWCVAPFILKGHVTFHMCVQWCHPLCHYIVMMSAKT